MSPVRLYIIASFAFFLLLSLVGDFGPLTEDFPERQWIQRFMLLGMIDILHDPSVVPRRFVGNMPVAPAGSRPGRR